MVAARTSGPKGRVSEWSNGIVLQIRDPLPRPVLKAEPHPTGVRVTVMPQMQGVETRVLRQTEGEAQASTVGTAPGWEFVDATAVLGKPYTYTAQFVAGTAESDVGEPVKVVPKDVFAPATPAGLTAVAGQNSIELAWERNTEADLRAYRVYRATGSGEFELAADGIEGPAYSDRQAKSGTAYRYQVTAVDAAGNESARSQTLEVTAP
jgi:fibronectin type 3 domain-containing protein